MAALEGDLVGRRPDSILDGLHHRGDPGRELVLERARKKSQRASAWHIGPGEDDLGDAPAAIKIGRMGGGDPGLAGARRPQHHHLRAGRKGIEVVALRRVERLDGGRKPFGLELGPLKFDDLGGRDRASVSASLLSELFTQGQTPFAEPKGIAGARAPRSCALIPDRETRKDFGSRRRGGRRTAFRSFRTRPPAHRFTIYEPPWGQYLSDSCDTLKEQRMSRKLSS